MQQALKRVNAMAPAHQAYMNNEVLPVLRSGFLPPLARGFDLFCADADVMEAASKLVDETMTSGATGEFDTHPTLRERLEALDELPHATASSEGPVPAASLMDDLERLGRALLEHAVGAETVSRLKPVGWDAVGSTVYGPQWHAMIDRHRGWLATLRADTLPIGPAGYITLGSALVGRDEMNVNSDERIARAVRLIATGMGSLLAGKGWTLRSDIAKPLMLVRGDERFDPFATVKRLADGGVSREQWQESCVALGIAGERLAPAAAPQPSS